jgi:uncharacterized protein (DUF1330 family)
MPAPAYLVVKMKLSNPEQYKEYMARAPAVVKAYGGEYLVRGGRQEVAEGNWSPARLAVVRFPSFEQAKAFFESKDYQAVRQHRLGATEYFNAMLVEGVAAPV